MFSLALMMMKKNLKSSLFYLFMMTLTIAINFIFTATSNTQLLGPNVAVFGLEQGSGTLSQMLQIVPASDYLNATIVIFCCFLIFYINNNFIYTKKK
ncbi:MAG: hypothetical protein Q4C49_09570 [Bacillota bacterium]|nr:hypothetical protein [Bacillota bacterium]